MAAATANTTARLGSLELKVLPAARQTGLNSPFDVDAPVSPAAPGPGEGGLI